MRRSACFMTMALAVAMLFFACHNEKYTITVNVNDPAMGTVTGGGEFKENTQITIEAKANEGYIFVSWSDGNTDNPRKVVVTANASYTAISNPSVPPSLSTECPGPPNPSFATISPATICQYHSTRPPATRTTFICAAL